MSTDRTHICHDLQPQLAAYALGETEPDSTLLTHLAACATCRASLQAYAGIARVLPYTAPQVAPSPDLRARILAAASPQPQGTPAPVRQPARKSMGFRWPWSTRLAWGFACALLLLSLSWNVVLQQRLNAQTAQLERLTAQVQRSRDNWQVMTQVLNTPDLQAYQLSGDTATGRFWASPKSDVACLVAQGLRDPGAGKVYQVWLKQQDTSVGAGTFTPYAGNGYILVPIEQPLTRYRAVGITIEPRGGSQSPTSQDVLAGPLAISDQAHTLSQVEIGDFRVFAGISHQ